MLEPISAALAGLATTKVLENLAGDCLYDVLKFGTAETGAALRQLVQERQQSGEIPTNHTLERGLRRAAVSASLAVVKPISSDALAHMFLAENRDTRPLEAVAEHLRRGLKAATGELEVLQRLYRHQDWDTPRRQARLKAHLAQSVSRPQTVRADADDIENVISRIAGTSDPTAPETPAAQALATIMLNVVIDACRLPHDLGEHVRAALTPRFAGDGADWGELFPLFFAQEMKDDPALHVILVQQRLSWNAEAVASLKDNLEAFRKEARAQANELMHQQLAASRRLETLIRNDARRSRQLSEILSIAWLLDARGPGHISGHVPHAGERRRTAGRWLGERGPVPLFGARRRVPRPRGEAATHRGGVPRLPRNAAGSDGRLPMDGNLRRSRNRKEQARPGDHPAEPWTGSAWRALPRTNFSEITGSRARTRSASPRLF